MMMYWKDIAQVRFSVSHLCLSYLLVSVLVLVLVLVVPLSCSSS